MRVTRSVVALLMTCLLWLCAAPALQAQTLTLATDGDHFTIDTGQGPKPQFLVLVSYFDGMRAAQRTRDLDYIAGLRGSAQSVQLGIRVFPNWSQYDHDYCGSAASDTVFNANGDINGTTSSGPLKALLDLLDAARARGLVVDLTFSRETIAGGPSVAAYTIGVANVATAVKAYRNVLFDLQNERDKGGLQHLASGDVAAVRAAVLANDPDRIVVASDSGGSLASDAVTLAGSGANGATLTAVAYHDPRTSTWSTDVTGVVQTLRTSGKPAYLQEPMPWNSGLSICHAQEPTDKEADGTADHFRDAVTRARTQGAAAWTFHTRQSFRLRDPDTPSNLISLEDLIRANGDERDLLEGTTSKASLVMKADSAQWTVNVPVRVTVTGSGHGVVTSSPAGIQCGTDSANQTSTACSASFTYGSDVTLLATPADGFTFGGWSGDCSGTGSCVVTLSSGLNVAAEFDGSAVPTTDTVQYYHLDAVGSVRATSDANGQTTARFDYMPFGVAVNPPSSDDPFRFASKERDAETSFDYFGARYLDAAQGRFITPDWSAKTGLSPYADLLDPQSFDLYVYGRNNPLRYRDPNGHFWDELRNWLGGQGWVTSDVVQYRQDLAEALFFFSYREVTIGNQVIDPTKLSDDQLVALIHEVHELEAAQMRENVKAFIRSLLFLGGAAATTLPSGDLPRLYRGGDSMVARPNDYKIDKTTGLVRTDRGVSLNSDPAALERFGRVREIESVPDELQIVQVGRPGHYEVTPRTPMAVERFQELLGQIKFK